MYVATVRFADLMDGKRIYEAGEQYPRPGLDVSPVRIAQLAGSDNRMGYPLIKALETSAEPAQTADDELITQSDESAKKRRRSRQKG